MPDQIPFVNLAYQHNVVREEMNKAIANVLESNSFILGEQLTTFEKQ